MSSPDAAAPRRPERYRADIEGLRAIAVLLVVAYHAGLPGIRAGFIGVDVFFVLSGYLITGLLVEEVERLGRIDLRGFYARRVRRLLPGAALMLVVTLTACVMLLAPNQIVGIARSAVATSVYSSNIYFMGREGNYFAEGSENAPLLHTWSLAVEEQFYLVWPVLLLVAVATLRSRARLAWLLVIVATLSFLGCLYLTTRHTTWAFYSSPARAWEFALGGLGWLLPPDVISHRWRSVVGWSGIALVLATTLLLTRYIPFPGSVALVPVMGTVLTLVAGAGHAGIQPAALLGSAPLRWLGRHSYSWYLWHWPVLVLSRTAYPGIGMPGRIVSVLAALAVATLAFSLVENPLRFSRRLQAKPVLSLNLALSLTATTTLGAYALLSWSSHERDSLSLQRYMAAMRDRSHIYSTGCVVGVQEASVRTCAFGDTASDTVVTLLGDSHAVQWFPALEVLAAERHWRLVTLLKVSCPAADVRVYNTSIARVEPECEVWRRSALDSVRRIHPARALLASSLHYPRLVDPDDEHSARSLEAWRDATRRTVAGLATAGIPVMLFRDTPRMPTVVPWCLARVALHSFYPERTCDGRRDDTMDEEIFRAEREGIAGLPQVSHIDLTDRFCDDTWCPAARGDTVVYFDNNHVTASYVRTLAPAIGRILTP